MLPGDAPSYRDRPEPTKWSKTVVGGVLVWPEIPNIRLALLARSRPPFSTISPARDEPYTWEHLREAFSTLRYRIVPCYMHHDLLRSPAISHDAPRNDGFPHNLDPNDAFSIAEGEKHETIRGMQKKDCRRNCMLDSGSTSGAAARRGTSPATAGALRHGGAPARAVGRWVGGWTAAAALVAALAVARVAAARGDVQVDEPAARGAAAVARATATAPRAAVVDARRCLCCYYLCCY